MIRLSPVQLGREEEEMVLEVIRSGRLAQGPMVQRLEGAFRELTGVREAVAVSSGTAALVLALKASGIGPGDEVVTSPFTFAASVNAILEVGATATFADIALDDYTLDPTSLEDSIRPETKAIMPVHLYGCPADMRAIAELAEHHGAAIIEDAAQAHGAVVDGRPAGSWGVGCFSLYATKNVTTGEGGILTTDDEEVAARLRLLRNQGMSERYRYEMVGHNYRMTELQAAIGVPQMARLGAMTSRRRSNAQALSEGLAGVRGLVLPGAPADRFHVFHQFTVRITGEARVNRDQLADQLASVGIESAVYYPRVVFDYRIFREHPKVRSVPVPHAEQAAREVLSLPVHPGLESGDIARIVETIRSFLHPGA